MTSKIIEVTYAVEIHGHGTKSMTVVQEYRKGFAYRTVRSEDYGTSEETVGTKDRDAITLHLRTVGLQHTSLMQTAKSVK
jgi:hypothetical protein